MQASTNKSMLNYPAKRTGDCVSLVPPQLLAKRDLALNVAQVMGYSVAATMLVAGVGPAILAKVSTRGSTAQGEEMLTLSNTSEVLRMQVSTEPRATETISCRS